MEGAVDERRETLEQISTGHRTAMCPRVIHYTGLLGEDLSFRGSATGARHLVVLVVLGPQVLRAQLDRVRFLGSHAALGWFRRSSLVAQISEERRVDCVG